MLQKHDFVFFIIFYVLFGPIGFLCYLLIKTTVGFYQCYRYRAIVTPTSIKWFRDNAEINISEIDYITADFEGGGFSLNILNLYISNSNKTMKACLMDCEVVKLAQTKLNSWVIEGDSLSIESGEPVASSVSYSASGKYNLGARLYSFIIMLTIVIALFFYIFAVCEKLYLLFVLIAVILVFFGLARYKKVFAILCDKSILFMDENGQQHCMVIEEITAVEKGYFRTKVTGADGRVFFFPRSFYFLPEFISYYAGIVSVRSKNY